MYNFTKVLFLSFYINSLAGLKGCEWRGTSPFCGYYCDLKTNQNKYDNKDERVIITASWYRNQVDNLKKYLKKDNLCARSHFGKDCDNTFSTGCKILVCNRNITDEQIYQYYNCANLKSTPRKGGGGVDKGDVVGWILDIFT